MAVRILENQEDGYKCMYCSTTMVAFGDIFYEDEEPQEFLDWLVVDPRTITEQELSSKVSEWRNAPTETVSSCCGASVDKDLMICSDCHEHLGDYDLEEIKSHTTKEQR